MRGRGALRRPALAAALALALAGACRQGLDPLEVPVDRADCARCRMLISDPANAGEVVFEDRDPRFYDDLGCLASDPIAGPSKSEAWVRVDGGSAWRRAREAFFARPSGARTPMGYGWAAFSSPEKARAADAAGHVRSWDDVRREASARPDVRVGGGAR